MNTIILMLGVFFLIFACIAGFLIFIGMIGLLLYLYWNKETLFQCNERETQLNFVKNPDRFPMFDETIPNFKTKFSINDIYQFAEQYLNVLFPHAERMPFLFAEFDNGF